METMQRLTIIEKTEKRPVAIRSRDVELDFRSIVNQLVSSIPKDVLHGTSYVEYQQSSLLRLLKRSTLNSDPA